MHPKYGCFTTNRPILLRAKHLSSTLRTGTTLCIARILSEVYRKETLFPVTFWTGPKSVKFLPYKRHLRLGDLRLSCLHALPAAPGRKAAGTSPPNLSIKRAPRGPSKITVDMTTANTTPNISIMT